MKMTEKVFKELQKTDKIPENAVKNDYKFLPIFQNAQIVKVEKLEKIAVFSNLFQLKKSSAKLMILQLWVFFIRYIIPILGLIILSTIETKGLSDVYFYSNSLAILLCLYLFFRINKIKNFMLKVTILIFVSLAFSTFFNLSIGIFSIDKFMYHFSYSLTFFMILFYLIKDIFLSANFAKIWYKDKNFYLARSSSKLSKLKKILIVFFTISALLTSVTMASMGYLVTSKKIEVAEKLQFSKE
ncbi:hypothetical protein Suden_1628 [Sulfurimonas denitrificans DSM 1251]|uniref:Uncharacterized protein n=1 Tax=Sulfurimonas denitrificans (strain ATCC 33889 / DSM 1251) TaxID=326298 RepID=Q30Q26_SULDN|nr:hypothetical protein [Sulfurimonas denitrificans]ABB44905.1 hypothetical protein Suden_1628 [Sulfurimonas denitrificans DSM 1251]